MSKTIDFKPLAIEPSFAVRIEKVKILIISLLFTKLVNEAPFSKSCSDECQPILKILSHQEKSSDD